MEISTVTGQAFYSGSWVNIKQVLKTLKVGEGKWDTLKKEEVNEFQERVDREIDGMLNDLYHTPFRIKKVKGSDGKFQDFFPGELRQAAIYWTAALLAASEFQQVSTNTNDQVNLTVEKAKGMVYDLRRNTHWIPASERKSQISRTMPTTWQPAWTLQQT